MAVIRSHPAIPAAAGVLEPPAIPAGAPLFHVGSVPVYGDAILAPMDGFSDWPYRSLCSTLGSAMSYTEFVNAQFILHAPDQLDLRLNSMRLNARWSFKSTAIQPTRLPKRRCG